MNKLKGENIQMRIIRWLGCWILRQKVLGSGPNVPESNLTHTQCSLSVCVCVCACACACVCVCVIFSTCQISVVAARGTVIVDSFPLLLYLSHSLPPSLYHSLHCCCAYATMCVCKCICVCACECVCVLCACMCACVCTGALTQ